MNSVEIADKEKALKQEAESLINSAKVEGRKLTEEEDVKFRNIQDKLNEVKENRKELDNKLNELNNTVKQEIRMNVTKTADNSKDFRLLDTINSIVNNRPISADTEGVLARGKEQMQQSGLSYSGQIQMPVNTRALDGVITGSNNYSANSHNGGKEAVPTDTLDIVTGLRGNLTLSQAGTTYITGLIGNVEIPTYSGTTVGWGTEVATASNGTGAFGAVTLSPKRLTAYVDVSKQFLIQTSDTAEAMLRNDIINALSAEIEKALLTTTAVSNAPSPIAASATSITTASDWFTLIAGLENSNYYGDFRVILSPSLKASLRGVKVTDNRLLYEDGFLDGYPSFVSTNVTSGLGFVGVFPELVVGQWGAIDIVVDPYSQAAAGKVRIVVNAYFDAALRRTGAIKAFNYTAPVSGGGN